MLDVTPVGMTTIRVNLQCVKRLPFSVQHYRCSSLPLLKRWPGIFEESLTFSIDLALSGLEHWMQCVTPRTHRVRQHITHSFYDIPHRTPVNVWGWTPSMIVEAQMHFSVNISIHTSLPHSISRVKPNVVHCDLGVHVRWRTRCGPGVSELGPLGG